MIYITIGEEKRRYDNATEQWITQQVNGRRRDNIPVCVQVNVNFGDLLNMVLRTPGCERVPSAHPVVATRRPNDQEARIFDLWARMGLNVLNFAPGQLIAFIHQLRRAT
jgi:hypothetical protein